MRTNPIESVAKVLLEKGKSHCLVPHDTSLGVLCHEEVTLSYDTEAIVFH